MNPEDFYKKFLDGAGLAPEQQEGAKRVLEVLRTEPAVMNRALPPAGYEADLLKSLRARLPQPSVPMLVPQRRESDRAWWRLGIFSPYFSWTITGSLTVAVCVLAFHFRDQLTRNFSPADLLTATAKQVPSQDMENWVASIGDSATQFRVAQTNLNAIAEAMSLEGVGLSTVDQALDKVAGDAGMQP